MNDWRHLTLDQAGVRLIDCVHKTPAAQEDGYPYVGIPQMKSGRIDFSDARRISETDFVEWTKKAKPERFDVILSRRTNPGVIAVDCTETPFALGQNLVLLRADGRTVFPPFLRWLCLSAAWWEQIEKYINVGAVFSSLRCGDVPKFELPIPPIEEQREIAAILGALDDKIELNRKTAATLEETARALYRSWFVDFDPVRAKLEGRAPAHMDAATAALFPDRFDDNGLPEGWKVSPLLDVVELLSGGTPKTSVSEFWDGQIKWASAKDVSQCGQAFLLDTERKITQAGLDRSSTKIIPRFSTVVVARGATTGRACMFGESIAMNQTCYALTSRDDLPFFANCLFMSEVLGITLAAHGSVFDTITTKTLQASTVVAPPEELAQSFETIVSPMFMKILEVSKENQNLANLRDTLLPRLMSGELRVGEAREQVEDVA